MISGLIPSELIMPCVIGASNVQQKLQNTFLIAEEYFKARREIGETLKPVDSCHVFFFCFSLWSLGNATEADNNVKRLCSLSIDHIDVIENLWNLDSHLPLVSLVTFQFWSVLCLQFTYLHDGEKLRWLAMISFQDFVNWSLGGGTCIFPYLEDTI